ncbi:MAG: hypothetical protein EOO05_01650 [Chitinophagaceae bacterium]|nr:MAG: hypothetical protein EOO05_01650 [Chitinophagaceae bacterium]
MSISNSQPGKQGTDPMDDNEDVKKSPDPKTDQDFPGYPDGPSTKEQVKPETPADKKSAGTDKRDGEKKLDADKKPGTTNEAGSDGSANAFDRTELHPPGAQVAPEVLVKKRRSDGSANAFERTEGNPLNVEEEDGPDSYY